MRGEKECEGCVRSGSCLIPVNICPCTICIVRCICTHYCYERHLATAKYYNVQPLSEDDLERVNLNGI